MLAIIAFSSLTATAYQFGLVIAPLTFSVQILSLLAVLTLFVFVPISIIGTVARLIGVKNQASGSLFTSIVSRFSMYLLYHLLMFGLWLLLASLLVGRLYQSSSSYSDASKPQSYQQEETVPGTDNRAETYSSDGTSNGLRAPQPNEDRPVSNQNQLPRTKICLPLVCNRERIPPEEELANPSPNQGACLAFNCEPYSLGTSPQPPYDPIYTKTDILGATYLLILIYPWLFGGYIILWTLFSTNVMYLIRNIRGKKPFAPTFKLYLRLTVWNALVFGIIAGLIHHFALY